MAETPRAEGEQQQGRTATRTGADQTNAGERGAGTTATAGDGLDSTRRSLAAPPEAGERTAPGAAQRPAANNWEQFFSGAVENIGLVNDLRGRTGLISDRQGRTFNAEDLRERAIQQTEQFFQAAIAGATQARSGAGVEIFRRMQQVDQFDQKMTGLESRIGADTFRQFGLTDQSGRPQRDLTSAQIQQASLNLELHRGVDGRFDSPKHEALSNYLTYAEGRAISQRGAADGNRNAGGAMYAALAYAAFLQENRPGGIGPIYDAQGRPTGQVVSATEIVRGIASADMPHTPEGRAAIARANQDIPFQSRFPNGEGNPMVTLAQVTNPNDLAPFRRAVDQVRAAGDYFDPRKTAAEYQKMVEDVRAGRVPDNDQTRQQRNELNQRSHVAAHVDAQMGLALMRQQNPNYPEALQYLERAGRDQTVASGQTGLMIDGRPQVPEAIRFAQQQMQQRGAESLATAHPELRSLSELATNPAAGRLAAEAAAARTRANQALSGINDQTPQAQQTEALTRAREQQEAALRASTELAEMIRRTGQEENINRTYADLNAKGDRRSASENEQFSAIREYYGALHQPTLDRADVGRLYARSGDPNKGLADIRQAMQDTHFMQQNPQVAEQIRGLEQEAEQARIAARGTLAQWSRAIAGGVALLGAAGVTYFTGGLGAPLGYATAAWGVGMIASVGVGAATGAYLRDGNLSWRGVGDHAGSAFTGAAIGAAGVGFALPRIAAAAAPEAGAVAATTTTGAASEAASVAPGLVGRTFARFTPEFVQTGWNTGRAAVSSGYGALRGAVTTPFVNGAARLTTMAEGAGFTPGAGQITAFQSLADKMIAAGVNRHVAVVGSRMAMGGAVGTIAELPQLTSADRPIGRYFEGVGMFTAMGAIGPVAGNEAGRLARLGQFGARTTTFATVDVGKNMFGEWIDPHRNQYGFGANVAATSLGDLSGIPTGYVMGGGLLRNPQMGRYFAPYFADGAKDSTSGFLRQFYGDPRRGQ